MFPLSLLQHPLAKGVDIDAPSTTALRRHIINSKPFLKSLYREWYETLRDALPPQPGAVLEIGSGAGDIREVIPSCLTSDILPVSGLDLILDGTRLPFHDGVLRAVVMSDVLHHIPRAGTFFDEAARCVGRDGVLTMVEPWVTPWSRFVYGHLHHEPFQPEAATWDFPTTGPLSGANTALPWILFHRDRAMFERRHPQWACERIRPFMPLAYLLSGGVSWKSLLPGWAYCSWRRLEEAARWAAPWTAMFAVIILRRTGRNA